MRALLFPHEGWENVYKKRVRGESLSLDPSMRSSVRSESFYLKFRPEPCTGVSLRTDSLWWLQFPNPHPHPCPKTCSPPGLEPSLGLGLESGYSLALPNYIGQGLCSWQRKHSSNSTWVILNESLYLVINFIIIQPLPLTPKFISQSKLAEIH